MQRARGGLAIHLSLGLLMGAMGGFANRSLLFFCCVAAGFGASLVGRLFLESRIEALSERKPVSARMLFFGLLLVNPAIWGVSGAVSILWLALNPASSWIWLAVTGMAASGAMSLSFDPVVRKCYAAFAVIPSAIALLFTESGQGLFEPLAAVLFLFYVYRGSKIVHDDYWSAVQSRIELEARGKLLEHLSATDALTQVSNRLHFDRQLGVEWARARRATPVGSDMTVIMLDIDHFKKVNDTYGHPFGDRCLQAVASASRPTLRRPTDLLARFGGEEFVAMQPGTGAAGAAIVSARMLAAVAAIKIDHQGESVPLTCSIGVHTMSALQTADPAAAVQFADQALYRAKRRGRNRVVVHAAAVDAVAALAA